MKIFSSLHLNENCKVAQKILIFSLTVAIMMLSGCSSHKFEPDELKKLGRVAVISDSQYSVFYVPSPLTKIKGEEKK